MSSARTRRPTPSTVRAYRPIPAAAAPPAVAPAMDERDFGGFVRAIGVGVAVGIPVVFALVTAIVRLAAPEWGLGAAMGVASWVAVWTGVFLGGTVTVGLWSHRRHPTG